MAETQVERIMRNLKCSKEEAEQIVADDKAIDRGERMDFDLSLEAEKQAKKFANTGTRQTNGQKTERKRKENPTKERIIQLLATFLAENPDFVNVNVLNVSRMIGFSCENSDFELTLIQKRAKKSS